MTYDRQPDGTLILTSRSGKQERYQSRRSEMPASWPLAWSYCVSEGRMFRKIEGIWWERIEEALTP